MNFSEFFRIPMNIPQRNINEYKKSCYEISFIAALFPGPTQKQTHTL